MFSRTILAAAISLAAMAAMAETPSEGYVGYITGKDVYVRSGASTDAYPVMKLDAPARVTVLSEQDGWLKIVPPEGAYSLVASQFLRVEGGVGTVTEDNVHVRAGSDLMPNRVEAIQLKLSTGEKVQVLGQRDTYAKIAPPKGAFLFVSAKFVKPIEGANVPVENPQLPKAVEQPTTLPAATVLTTRASDDFMNQLAQIKEADEARQAEMLKPREQRNYAGLMDRYTAIKLAPNSPLAPYLQARVQFVQGEIDLIKQREEAARLSQQANDTDRDIAAKIEAQKRQIRDTVTTAPTTQAYAAEGILVDSEIHRGDFNQIRKFGLRNPANGMIFAYVQCTAGTVDLENNLGRKVSVSGTPTFSESLRMYVIEAEKLDVLEAAPAKAPVKATTLPTTLPTPAPAAPSAATPAPAPVAVPTPVATPAPAAAQVPVAVPVTPAPAPVATPAAPTSAPTSAPTTAPAAPTAPGH